VIHTASASHLFLTKIHPPRHLIDSSHHRAARIVRFSSSDVLLINALPGEHRRTLLVAGERF
jgi:hypothetical protein